MLRSGCRPHGPAAGKELLSFLVFGRHRPDLWAFIILTVSTPPTRLGPLVDGVPSLAVGFRIFPFAERPG